MLVTERVIRRLVTRVRGFESEIAMRGPRAEIGDAPDVEAEARRLRLQTLELMLTRDEPEPFEAMCERLEYIAEMCDGDRLRRLQVIQRELARGGDPVDLAFLIMVEAIDGGDADDARWLEPDAYEWSGPALLGTVIRL